MHGREGEEREYLSQGRSGETGRMLMGTSLNHLVLVISGASELQRAASLDGGGHGLTRRPQETLI